MCERERCRAQPKERSWRSARRAGVGGELREERGEGLGVLKVESGVAPDLAERGDVAGDDGGATEGGFKRGEAEGLVDGESEVDGGGAEVMEEVGFVEAAEERRFPERRG